MREIYYNSDITPKATNEIKLLTLYYDKINIVNDAVYSPKFDSSGGEFKFSGVEDLLFIPKSFSMDYKILLDENILEITKRGGDEEFEKKYAKKISDLINANHDLIFPRHPKDMKGNIV